MTLGFRNHCLFDFLPKSAGLWVYQITMKKVKVEALVTNPVFSHFICCGQYALEHLSELLLVLLDCLDIQILGQVFILLALLFWESRRHLTFDKLHAFRCKFCIAMLLYSFDYLNACTKVKPWFYPCWALFYFTRWLEELIDWELKILSKIRLHCSEVR